MRLNYSQVPMTNGELNQELRFLLGPGLNSTSPHSNRNIDSNVIEIATIV